MTVATVRQSLIDLADFLEATGSGAPSGPIAKLIDFLEQHKAGSMSAFLKKAKPREEIASSWTGQKVSAALDVIHPYLTLVERLVGKAKSKELRALADFLEDYAYSDLEALIAAAHLAVTAPAPKKGSKKKTKEIDLDLVERYSSVLKSALGNDKEFGPAITSLKGDKAAGKEEVSEIAKRVVSSLPKGLTRAKALQAITELHKSAMGFNLKMKSMGGRTAA